MFFTKRLSLVDIESYRCYIPIGSTGDSYSFHITANTMKNNRTIIVLSLINSSRFVTHLAFFTASWIGLSISLK